MWISFSFSQGSASQLDAIMAEATTASRGSYKLLIMFTSLKWPGSAHTPMLACHLNAVSMASSYDRYIKQAELIYIAI